MKVTLSTSGGTTNLIGTVTVTATPQPTTVTSIQFYVDDVAKGSLDTTSPYIYSWDTTAVAAGGHQLKAVALYPRNKRAEGKLDVTVADQSEPPPPPPPPIEAPPVNSVVPIISGTTTEGQTLSVSDGDWTNSPTSYTRQWLRCDAAGANPVLIPSATAASYVLTATDVGATIRCSIIASNVAGPSAAVQTAQTAVVSSLAPAVPVLVSTPVITGTPTQGYTLAVSNGSWTNAPTSYTRQWLGCNSSGGACASIAGATAATYLLTATDAGKTIRCQVTAVNAAGSSAPVQSAATAVVAAPPPPSLTFGSSLPARIPSPFALPGVPANGLTQTNYFVATNGNNTTGNGSIGSPWLTIDKAFDTVGLAGSVINLRAGDYGGATWDRVGSSANPVTLRSYQSEVARIVDGRLLCQNAGAYLRVYNVKFLRGSPECIKVARAAHIEFFGLTIENSVTQGILVGTSATGVTNDIQIWNTLFFDCGSVTLDSPQTHSVYYGAGGVTNGVIANCISYAPSSRSYQLYPGANGVILANCIGDDSHNKHGAVIGGDDVYATSNARIVNSIFTNNADQGVNVAWGAAGSGSGNNVQNCLAFGNNGSNYVTGAGGVTFVNANVGNPLYANQAGRDYHLQAGSPALGAGVVAYTPAFDFAGNARVAADLGPYRA